MIPTATCQYCGWQGPAEQCGPLRNAWERVQPGDIMPAGECPECNASAMLDPDPDRPRIVIDTTTRPESATHFPSHYKARALSLVAILADRNFTYPVQDMDEHGHRVAVHRKPPHSRMFACCYLRVRPT